ncbi:PAS domain S-box [Actinobacteria bacterium IMCC26207]|nr:PAS domain S-box [Actinobacteria bacterium IMCC26207]
MQTPKQPGEWKVLPGSAIEPAEVILNSPDLVVCVDPEFRIEGVGGDSESFLGIAAEELLGRPALELIHLDDRDRVMANMKRFADGQETYRPELRLLHRSGQAVVVEIVGRRLSRPDGTHFLLVARRQLGLGVRQVADDIGIGILRCDPHGEIHESNAAASMQHGYEGEELFGRIQDLRVQVQCHPEDCVDANLHPALRYLEDAGVSSQVATIVGRDGVSRVISFDGRRVKYREDGTPGIIMLLRDVTEMHQMQQELYLRSTRDDLTGLLKRSTFIQAAESLLKATVQQSGEQPGAQSSGNTLFGVLFCDIDRFKSINERHGHGEADRFLAELSADLAQLGTNTAQLGTNTEASLSAGGTTSIHLGRIGGDEFALAVQCNDRAEFDRLAAGFRASVQRTALATLHVLVTASVGVAVFDPQAGQTVGVLLDEANAVLRLAKGTGRDQILHCDASLRAVRSEQKRLEGVLRAALSAGRIEYALQPVVDPYTGMISGAEALARLRDDNGRLVPAAAWIEVAVSAGLSSAVDAAVVEPVIELLGSLVGRCPRGLPVIGVNLSDTTLARPDLAEWIFSLLERHQVDPVAFLVEVPELVLPVIRERAAEALRQFREKGLWLAVDDFGSGYASFNEVRDLPLDTLKIDRSFLTEQRDSADYIILRTALEMTHALGCRSVAEGVETQAELEIVMDLRVDYVQGYLLARPMPPDDFVRLLLSDRPLAPQRIEHEDG